MAASVVPYITVDEYLHSSYDPDVDYVDGALEERNLGEYDHGDLQLEIGFTLRAHSEDWQIRVVVEARIQVTPTRFRVPDVCVMPLAWKRTPIIREAPLLCVEVLSPQDRIPRILTRCREYIALGAKETWVFDPAKRLVHRVTGSSVSQVEGSTLSLAGTPITIDLAALFAVLDR